MCSCVGGFTGSDCESEHLIRIVRTLSDSNMLVATIIMCTYCNPSCVMHS